MNSVDNSYIDGINSQIHELHKQISELNKIKSDYILREIKKQYGITLYYIQVRGDESIKSGCYSTRETANDEIKRQEFQNAYYFDIHSKSIYEFTIDELENIDTFQGVFFDGNNWTGPRRAFFN
jgi:hypothetical protein